jgi:hypothetical protein
VRTLGPRSPPRRLGHSTQEETSPKEPPSARYCECTRPGWAREVAGPAYPMWPTERAVRPMNRAATTATVGRQPHDARAQRPCALGSALRKVSARTRRRSKPMSSHTRPRSARFSRRT